MMVVDVTQAAEQAATGNPDQTVDQGALDAANANAAVGSHTDPSGGPDSGAAVPGEQAPAPQSLEDLVSQNPALANEIAEREQTARNAGSQSREQELRTQAGSRERTAEYNKRVAQELGIDVDAVDPAKFALQYDLAYSHAATDIATELPGALLANYDIPVSVREEAMGIRDAGRNNDPSKPDVDGYVRTLIDGTVLHQRDQSAYADIVEGSPLHASIEAEIGRRAGQEQSAAVLQSGQSGAQRPNVSGSGGSAGGDAGVNLTSLVGISKAYNDGHFGDPLTDDAVLAYREAYNKVLTS